MHEEDIKYMRQLSYDVLDNKISNKEAQEKLKKVHDRMLPEITAHIIAMQKRAEEKRNK